MDYQANEITILTNSEFVLLLAAAGIDKWYGMEADSFEGETIDDRSFNRNMFTLYQKQIIDFHEKKAAIADTYKPYFRVLRDAGSCITIRSARRPGYVRGCYFSDNTAVSVERRTGTSDEIELYMQTITEWLDDLKQGDLYPMTAGDPLEFEADSGHSNEYSYFTITEEKELLSEFELRKLPDGLLTRAAKLYQRGLFGTVEYTCDSEIEEEYFSESSFETVLDRWIGGKE